MIEFLKKVPIFSNLEEKECEKIIKISKLIHGYFDIQKRLTLTQKALIFLFHTILCSL